MNAEKKFEFVSSSEDFFIATKSNSKFQIKGLNFLRTNGDIYRCKGNHSKRGRSIIFVQKLIMKRSELNLKQQYFKARFKFINLYSK